MLRNRREVARALSQLYPPAQRDSGVAGAVVMRFEVFRDGTVNAGSIEAALATDPAFEQAAAAVVRLTRFTPARNGGRPVPLWITMPIQFALEEEPAQRDTSATP